MRIFTDIDALPKFDRPVVTVGSFDGVHLGHRFLLEILNERRGGGESVVVTFASHPRQVLGEELRVLTSFDEKAALLSAAGVDNLVVMPFTVDIAEWSAERFVRDFLVARLGVAELVVGYNHRLGRDRSGDITVLSELGARYGFRVFRAPQFSPHDKKISSTAIRRALAAGDIAAARSMLGRPV